MDWVVWSAAAQIVGSAAVVVAPSAELPVTPYPQLVNGPERCERRLSSNDPRAPAGRH